MNLVRTGTPSLLSLYTRRTAHRQLQPSRPTTCTRPLSWLQLPTRPYSDTAKVDEKSAPDAQSEQAPTSDNHQSSPSTADTDTDAVKEIKAKLAAKEAEVVDLTGRLRYSQADYQNLQRIAAKEKDQTRDFAITRFATDLLDTVDVLSLALRSIPASYASPPPPPDPSDDSLSSSSSSSSSPHSTPSQSTVKEKTPDTLLRELYTGVSLTNKQLLATFGNYGITQYDPMGEKFDPNLHEALYAAPILGKEPGTVVETQKLGYMIKGRVLRAAQVGIVQETA